MPEICRFFGMIVQMYYSDHEPPHFHLAPAYFEQVRADSEPGTVTWPNGADLDPDVLYGRVTGIPVLAEFQ